MSVQNLFGHFYPLMGTDQILDRLRLKFCSSFLDPYFHLLNILLRIGFVEIDKTGKTERDDKNHHSKQRKKTNLGIANCISEIACPHRFFGNERWLKLGVHSVRTN